jgi:hypothetical protein
MRHAATAMIAAMFIALPARAVEPGRAEGAVMIDGQRIDLQYAYAVGHHKNQITNKSDNTLIVLSDKPLPDGANLHEFEATLPDGFNGVMVCIDGDRKITHVAVQHPSGMYDGGFFEGVANYDYKVHRGEGPLSGTLTSRKIKTNTMTFWYDVSFNATVK